jgi:hypothetical protein
VWKNQRAFVFGLITLVSIQRQGRADVLDDLIEGWHRAETIDGKAKQVYGPATKSLNVGNSALEGDPIVSDNELINKVRHGIRELNREIGPESRRNINDWRALSGANVFSINQTAAALRKLQSVRTRFQKIEGKCEVLRTVVLAMNVADHMDVKNLGKNITSLKILDIEARKETLEELDRCKGYAQKAVAQLDSVIGLESKNLDDMIRTREQFERMQGQPLPIPKPVSPTSQGSEAGEASRSSAVEMPKLVDGPAAFKPLSAQAPLIRPMSSMVTGRATAETPPVNPSLPTRGRFPPICRSPRFRRPI